MAHITILASLGGHQSIENGLIRGRYSTLVETQVCKCVVGQEEAEISAFVSGELVGWVEKRVLGNTQLSGYRTRPIVLGYSECYTFLSHCALPRKKLKPSTSEDMRLFQ